MEQNLNVYQTNKKSLAAVILMIMSASFAFLHGFLLFALAWPVGFDGIISFLVYISPMIILSIYMLAYQNKQKATALVPVAFIVLTVYLFFTTLSTLIKAETYNVDASSIITLVLTLTCYIPLIVFSSLIIATAYKGMKSKAVVNAYSVFTFIIVGVKFIYFTILYLQYSLDYRIYAYYLFDLLAITLFAISIIVFTIHGNIPSIIKPFVPQVDLCPTCGEKYLDGAVFCHKCGKKR